MFSVTATITVKVNEKNDLRILLKNKKILKILKKRNYGIRILKNTYGYYK
jgi:hypothetical protein